MFVSFLLSVTIARAAVYVLPAGLFFAAASDPVRAPDALATASALTVGSGLALWPSGRLLDRIGPWRGLRWAMVVGALSLAVLALGVWHAWPLAALLAVAFGSGAIWSPVIATPRAVLPAVVHRGRLAWASGIEAASLEVALIVAPVVGALLARFGPAAVPAAASGLLAVAAAVLPGRDGRGQRLAGDRAFVSRRTLALGGLALLLGLSGGLMEPGLADLPSPPFGDVTGNAVRFIAIGLGSAAGGLLAARTGWPSRSRDAVPLFLLHAAALAAVTATDGITQMLLLVAAGVPIAPLQSLAGLHLDRWTARHRISETFGLIASAHTLGAGVGQAITSQLAGRLRASGLLLLAAVPPIVAALLVVMRREDSL